jgi:uncharacterized protein (DUF1499 family)
MMTDSVLPNGLGPVRSTRWASRGGIGAGVLALLGTWGTGLGLWHFSIGFILLAAALVFSVIALITGAYALIKGRGSSTPRGGVWLGLLCVAIFFGWLGSWASKGSSAPMIHDITTDTANPPAFVKLELRKDNLVGLKSVEEWRKIHAAAYSDVKPLTLPMAPAEVIATAESLIKARGWDIALVTPNRIEATETVSAFRFKDDVVITAVASPDGKGSIVNIRSVSRVGTGDLGVNAARVRALLKDLKGA